MNKNLKNLKVNFYDNQKLLMEIVPLFFLIAMISVAFYIYPMLPDKVPIHWNSSGQVDNYGSKLIASFLFPLIYLLFVIFSFLLPAMDVFSDNIKKSYNYYYAFKIVFGLFFLIIYIATLLPNFGYQFNIATAVFICVTLLFFFLGYIMRNIKRNYFFGIRTPWTLTSEKIWDQTHKVGGIVLMAYSVLLLLAILFVQLQELYIGFMISLILVVFFLMFYSYYLYRKEK